CPCSPAGSPSSPASCPPRYPVLCRQPVIGPPTPWSPSHSPWWVWSVWSFCGCPRSVTSHGVPRQPEKPGNTASFGCLHVFGRSDLPPCRACPPGGAEVSGGRVLHRPSVPLAEPVHHGSCVLTPSLGVAVITAFLPADLTLARLKRLAQEHARQLDLDSSHVPPVRSMVNYLRHECTDYDLEQSASRHRAACEAIARRFPQLAKECRRQIADRKSTRLNSS